MYSDTSLTASTIQVRDTQRARQRIVGVKHCPLEKEFVIPLTVSKLNIMQIFLIIILMMIGEGGQKQIQKIQGNGNVMKALLEYIMKKN